jgi:hypothetical protein
MHVTHSSSTIHWPTDGGAGPITDFKLTAGKTTPVVVEVKTNVALDDEVIDGIMENLKAFKMRKLVKSNKDSDMVITLAHADEAGAPRSERGKPSVMLEQVSRGHLGSC